MVSFRGAKFTKKAVKNIRNKPDMYLYLNDHNHNIIIIINMKIIF